MKKKIVICLIIIMAVAKVLYTHFTYDNKEYDQNKTIYGKITYIKSEDKKTTIDISSKKKIRVTIYKKTNYDLGDVVVISGSIKNAQDNSLPNTFNYRKYLLSKRIKYVSINPSVKLVSKNSNVFYALKNNIIKRIKKYKSYKYLNTFILGDTSKIDDDIKDGYKKLGISHLFCVSGMHVGLILLVVNFIIKKRSLKYIVMFLILTLLLFLTNYTESLLRCFVFLLLSIINKEFNFKIKNEILIVLTASILLICNSYYIYSVGFSFSITITFFIILSKDIITGNYFIKTFKLSIICFLSSVPIIAFSFYEINILSPVFNALLIPFVSMLLFPIGVLTLFIPILDNVYYVLTTYFETFTSYLSNINIFSFVISKPNIIAVFLYYLILYLSIKKDVKYIIIFVVIMIININSRFLIFTPSVTYIDVGQGDSSLIIYPKGKTVLIDTGGNPFGNYSIVKSKTIPYLKSMGISNIKAVIITHGDFDHCGEAIDLVEDFKVDKVIFNCGKYNDLEKDLIKKLDKKKIKYYSCINKLDNLYFLQTRLYNNENDNSNVVYTKINGYKFMFMGDAGIEKEKDILDEYNISNVDVLKVGHHGSKTSSSEDFINKINPKYSIISVGKNNRYGHPNKEVLNNLKGSKIYRTDKNGSVIFRIKNKLMHILTMYG